MPLQRGPRTDVTRIDAGPLVRAADRHPPVLVLDQDGESIAEGERATFVRLATEPAG